MNHACLYSPAAKHHRTLAGTHFPFRWVRRLHELAWVAWWNTEVVYPPKTVTHPSTNRARRGVTSLIRPTTLPLRHAATPSKHRSCSSSDTTSLFSHDAVKRSERRKALAHLLFVTQCYFSAKYDTNSLSWACFVDVMPRLKGSAVATVYTLYWYAAAAPKYITVSQCWWWCYDNLYSPSSGRQVKQSKNHKNVTIFWL